MKEFMEEVEELVLEVINEINSKMEERSVPYKARKGEKLLNNGEKLPSIIIGGETYGICCNITANTMVDLKYNRGEVIEDMINSSIARLEDEELKKIQEALESPLLIRPKLVNRERNEELLSLCPHRNILDLSLVYERKLPEIMGEDSVATMKVTKDLPWTKDMSEEEIYSLTEEYIEDNYSLTPLMEFVKGMMDELDEFPDLPEEDVLHILSVGETTGDCGAAVLGYPKVLKEVSERMKGSYYIFPSSIHEVLVISERTGMSEEYMKEMIEDANLKFPRDIVLSDNLYFYNAETEELSIVD